MRKFRLQAAVAFALCPLLLSAAGAGEDRPTSEFPTQGLLPKEEIGALRLLEKHPEFDGRGVVVAVFDTGVDPGAAGLATTSDGRPKIIDLIDATGSGDVDMRHTVEVEQEKNAVEGLTGRMLQLDPRWLKTDRTVRLGIKHAFDFFPGFLQARMKRERREEFDRAQRETELALRRRIAAWDEEHEKPSQEERAFRKELDVRLKQLLAAGEQAEDPGPVYDCLVYRDGDAWLAVVDTDEDGDLTDEKTLADFHREREYATFGGGAEMNFGVNIYDDGDTLSIVADSGAHATHVAGIIAGHFPEQPQRNGIAPGAQIVSIKIGDGRMGSMESGTALVRGLTAAVESGCDLINMSYGESTTLANRGRILDLITEAVDEHGVMFVAAAGNNGPGLGTIIAPGGVTEAVMGVGAYISPAMMQVEYTLRGELPEMPFSWSSRGPAADGAFGVDVFAPGAAIASVPNWTLNRSMQMNGTSMASPNACGASALLLSALKAEKKPYTPYSVRRALQNTARPIDDADALTQGAGLIQVDAALAYLLEHAEHQSPTFLRYDVSVRGGETTRGVLLREPHQLCESTQHSVRIRPVFHDDAPAAEKLAFERRITLEATQPWVRVGRHLLLTSMGRSFEVEVDPTQLEPGVHLAEIHGVDADHPEAGPLFHLPVVVAKTVPVESAEPNVYRESAHFQPGQVLRRFLEVPLGATWAEVRLHAAGGEREREFVIHTDQPQTGQAFVDGGSRQQVTLGRGRDVVRNFAVRDGCSLELCVAQYWSSLGETEVELELTYHGLAPDRQSITLSPGEAATPVEVTARLQRATLAPQARLTTLRQSLRPSSATIRPLLSPREKLLSGEIEYELVLEYRFQQREPGSVTPRFPMNDGLFYDSPSGEQLWMLFDAGKRLITVDDWRPDAVRLGKGEHVLRLQLRDSNLARLEEAKNAILWLDRSLKSPLSLTLYTSRADALAGQHAFSRRQLEQGEHVELYVAAPPAGRIPEEAQCGDVLLGAVTFGEDDASSSGAGRRPGGYELSFAVPPVTSKNSMPDIAKTEKDFEQEQLQLRIEQIKRLDESQAELFEKLAQQLLEEHPGNLDVLTARLHRLDHVAHRKTRLPEVVKAADAVLAQINSTQINATQIDAKSAAHKKIQIDTLYRKGRALGYMELPDVIDKHPIEDPQAHDEAFEANFAELQKLVDTTGDDYFLLHLRRDRRKQRHGQALELLNRHIPRSAPNYWHYKKRRDLYDELNWQHLHVWEAAWLVRRFPQEYAPF
ncbi:MAG: S8 family serine peptidase [Pirellulaceae bacterium]